VPQPKDRYSQRTASHLAQKDAIVITFFFPLSGSIDNANAGRLDPNRQGTLDGLD